MSTIYTHKKAQAPGSEVSCTVLVWLSESRKSLLESPWRAFPGPYATPKCPGPARIAAVDFQFGPKNQVETDVWRCAAARSCRSWLTDQVKLLDPRTGNMSKYHFPMVFIAPGALQTT